MKFFAARVGSVQPSMTLAISAKAGELRARGIDVVGFGVGEPDFDTPDNIKMAARKAIEAGFTKYTAASGIRELKEAVCAALQRERNLKYEPAEVLISCGAKHALYNIAQALFDRGDEVIIPSPYWVSYPDQVRLQEAVPRIVETREEDGFRLTGDLLRANLTDRTRAVVLNSPSNPTGCGYTLEQLREIAEVIVEKDLYVISDEIYDKLTYGGFVFHSIAELGAEVRKRTILVNGVSKTYAMTGWRIGWAVGPADVIRAMATIQSQSTSNPTSISQMAAVEALNGPQDTVAGMVREFDKRRRYMLERMNAVEGVSCVEPDGAFYLFPRVDSFYGSGYHGMRIESSLDLAEYLLKEARVAVVPGIAFGADAYFRLSYATSMEVIQKGLDRIEEAFGKLT